MWQKLDYTQNKSLWDKYMNGSNVTETWLHTEQITCKINTWTVQMWQKLDYTQNKSLWDKYMNGSNVTETWLHTEQITVR